MLCLVKQRVKYSLFIAAFLVPFIILSFFSFSDFCRRDPQKFVWVSIVKILSLIPLIWISQKEILLNFGKEKNSIPFLLVNLIFILLPNFIFIYWNQELVNLNTKNCKKYLLTIFAFLFASFGTSGVYYTTIEGNNSSNHFKNKNFLFSCMMGLFFCFWFSFIATSFLLGTYILIILILISIFNDSFAYLFGKKFGKRKIFKTSPNKTLEGYIFGIFFGALCAWSLFLICIKIFSIHHKLEIRKINNWSLFLSLIIFIALSIISHVGDMLFSSFKRRIGIKDFGTIFGPHGGFWDRFDSHALLFVTIFLIFYPIMIFSSDILVG